MVEELFEVEKILQHGEVKGEIKLLIKWKNYDD
jgi:hypothetical protein